MIALYIIIDIYRYMCYILQRVIFLDKFMKYLLISICVLYTFLFSFNIQAKTADHLSCEDCSYGSSRNASDVLNQCPHCIRVCVKPSRMYLSEFFVNGTDVNVTNGIFTLEKSGCSIINREHHPVINIKAKGVCSRKGYTFKEDPTKLRNIFEQAYDLRKCSKKTYILEFKGNGLACEFSDWTLKHTRKTILKDTKICFRNSAVVLMKGALNFTYKEDKKNEAGKKTGTKNTKYDKETKKLLLSNAQCYTISKERIKRSNGKAKIDWTVIAGNVVKDRHLLKEQEINLRRGDVDIWASGTLGLEKTKIQYQYDQEVTEENADLLEEELSDGTVELVSRTFNDRAVYTTRLYHKSSNIADDTVFWRRPEETVENGTFETVKNESGDPICKIMHEEGGSKQLLVGSVYRNKCIAFVPENEKMVTESDNFLLLTILNKAAIYKWVAASEVREGTDNVVLSTKHDNPNTLPSTRICSTDVYDNGKSIGRVDKYGICHAMHYRYNTPSFYKEGTKSSYKLLILEYTDSAVKNVSLYLKKNFIPDMKRKWVKVASSDGCLSDAEKANILKVQSHDNVDFGMCRFTMTDGQLKTGWMDACKCKPGGTSAYSTRNYEFLTGPSFGMWKSSSKDTVMQDISDKFTFVVKKNGLDTVICRSNKNIDKSIPYASCVGTVVITPDSKDAPAMDRRCLCANKYPASKFEIPVANVTWNEGSGDDLSSSNVDTASVPVIGNSDDLGKKICISNGSELTHSYVAINGMKEYRIPRGESVCFGIPTEETKSVLRYKACLKGCGSYRSYYLYNNGDKSIYKLHLMNRYSMNAEDGLTFQRKK